MFSSYTVYIATVLLASVFASLAQKYSRTNKKGIRIPNKFFWFISMAILIFIMGFREYTIGVDGASYIRGYNIANSMSFIDYYSSFTTEPGFYLLYRLVYFIFNDYQWLFIITAAITIACFYKAFSYEIDNISLGLAVFIFASTNYFYYFGIMRMGVAVSIVAVAYRYILQNEKKKYIWMVLLATLFHYSAPFALAALFIKPNQITNRFKNSTLIKIMILIPLGFYGVRYLIYPFISASRYQRYIDSTGTISLGFLTSSLPFLIIFLFFYNRLVVKSENYQFYFFLFIIKLFTEIFAPIIGIGRMVWYVNISLCFLLPATLRVNKDHMIKLGIIIFIILYCVIYSNYAYFGESFRGQFMLPYENVFFKLSN